MVDQPLAPETEAKENWGRSRVGLMREIDKKGLCEGLEGFGRPLFQRRVPKTNAFALIVDIARVGNPAIGVFGDSLNGLPTR